MPDRKGERADAGPPLGPARAATWRRQFGRIGPGLISGAANDDPSCIVTFAMAGAAFGYLTLWTSLFALPLLAGVQLLCSRLGMVSGRGLVGAAREIFPRWALVVLSLALVIANIVTLGADLAGMGAVTAMIAGGPAFLWAPAYAVAVIVLLFRFPYRRIQTVLRWLCVALFAYIAAGLLSGPDWRQAAIGTLVPRIEWSGNYLAVLVAIIGATVSPYFLFWQVAQETEEEYAAGRRTVAERQGATAEELAQSRTDVIAGAFASKLITYFITLTTAAALFENGIRRIATADDAAAALAPVAGPAASWLFALGVIGTGMLAVPVLATSCAHAVAEVLNWPASLERSPRVARGFYAVLAIAVLLGSGLAFVGFNPVDMLFWASVGNGIVAVPSILLVVRMARSRRAMGGQRSPRWLAAIGWASAGIVAAGAVALVVTLVL
jgi:NRAMP (natural resistance-associated macrophage protein)-like metal ion transporter